MSITIASTNQYESNTLYDHKRGANVLGTSDLSSAVSWQSRQTTFVGHSVPGPGPQIRAHPNGFTVRQPRQQTLVHKSNSISARDIPDRRLPGSAGR